MSKYRETSRKLIIKLIILVNDLVHCEAYLYMAEYNLCDGQWICQEKMTMIGKRVIGLCQIPYLIMHIIP
jgi:hypothetical protein